MSALDKQEGPETKIYCYCKVKGDVQKWIDQLKHEHKLYQKHLGGLNKEIERLEAEITELKQKISSVWEETEEFYLDD